MRMAITRAKICSCACSSRASGRGETYRVGGGCLPEVKSGQSRVTCLAWHSRQMCQNLHLEKEHSPLFQCLRTSTGKPDGVDQLAGGARLTDVVELGVGGGLAKAISHIYASRRCHSSEGFVAAVW